MYYLVVYQYKDTLDGPEKHRQALVRAGDQHLLMDFISKNLEQTTKSYCDLQILRIDKIDHGDVIYEWYE